LAIEPEPEITPEKVVLVLSEPMLKASLLVARTTLPLPDNEPMVSAALLDKENVAPLSTIKPDTSFKAPFPNNFKVPPPVIVVVPLYVLAALNAMAPPEGLSVSGPLPLIVPEILAFIDSMDKLDEAEKA
jgi:hypothetical protein